MRDDEQVNSLLDMAGAAQYLSLSKDQVYLLARTGQIPAVHEGHSFSFQIKDLDAYLQQSVPDDEHFPSDALFARAFYDNPHPMSISTLQSGLCLEVNDSLLALTGYRRDEIVGHTTVELQVYSNPQDRERIIKLLTEQGFIHNLEINFRLKSGTIIIGLLFAEVIEFKGEMCVLASVTDITERKHTEQRLRTQYAITRVLAESSTLDEATPKLLQTICESLDWLMGVLWRVDEEKHVLRCVEIWCASSLSVPQFKELTRKSTFTRNIGLPGRVWASGKPFWITDVTADNNFPRVAVAAAEGIHGAVGFPLLSGRKVRGIMEFFSREIRPLNEDVLDMMATAGSQIGQFIVRKIAEEASRESEDRFRTVAENASDAIITIDGSSTILFVNNAAQSVFGYSREEILGQELTMLMPEYLRHLHRAGINRYLETGKKHIAWKSVELPGLHKDGHEIPLELSFGEFIKNGQHFFTGIARDITDRRRLEDALRQRADELTEANRIKDEFLATLSHELRTPLTSILGWSHLLRTGEMNALMKERAIEAIERNAMAQAQLIEDLLDVSRVITGKLRLDARPFNLTSVVENAVEAVRPSAQSKSIALELRLIDDVGTISGDPDRLQQVIWNLLTNAIKFTPERGRVEVRLEQVDSSAHITVSDTGVGISPEFLPFVFERFRQADSSSTRSYSGLGLGLALARHLVEMHGGTVEAESAGAGAGATFKVHIPLNQTSTLGWRVPVLQTNSVSPIVELDQAHQLKGMRVLVVDDEFDARELLTAALSQAGAQVTACESAADALSALKHNDYDVLISDIGMPEEDGYTLINKVRALSKERARQIPALALTAYARDEDRRRALAAGFQTHVPKPIEPSRLVEMVSHMARPQE